MILVKKLTEDAFIPKKSYNSDAGYDIHSNQEVLIPKFSRKTISTGIAIQLDTSKIKLLENQSFYFRIAPRSGMASKYGIDVFAGVIDRNYTGEIKICLFNSNDKEYLVKKGDKIAQLIPTIIFNCDIRSVQQIKQKDRSEKGFGSSGR